MEADVSFDDFQKIDLRAGTIIAAEPFEGLRKPAYKLKVDLGEEIGIRTSSAQLTAIYTPSSLVGRQVICVVNIGHRMINGFRSEILVTGFYRDPQTVVLASPSEAVPNGTRLS